MTRLAVLGELVNNALRVSTVSSGFVRSKPSENCGILFFDPSALQKKISEAYGKARLIMLASKCRMPYP